jgi:prepilin-type processing-associated H-X9-DG protein
MTDAARPGSSAARRVPWVYWLIGIVMAAGLAAAAFWFVKDAREAAAERPRTAVCQGNLRRIWQAVQMYVQDSDGSLPNSGSGSGSGDIVDLLEPYAKQGYGKGMWRCPSQTGFSEGRWTTSYGYNWQYLFAPDRNYPHDEWHGFDNPGVKLSSVKRPAETLMWVDHKPLLEKPYAELWSYVVRPSQKVKDPHDLDGMGRPDFRHRRQANVLFCDGHVMLMGREIAEPTNEKKHWDPR